MSTSLLSCQEVSLSRGARAVLAGISFDAKAGELVALLGANGAGKTTLLGALAGLVTPTRGTVSLGERPVRERRGAELARHRAWLGQEAQLDFGMSAREVVMLARTPHPPNAGRDEAACTRAMKALGVDTLGERPYHALSGGEQRRVQLARALAQLDDEGPWPQVLLLDEPTESLDLGHEHLVFRHLRQWAGGSSSRTCVVAMHDLNLAARYATTIVLLARGRVLAQGSAASVLTPENIECAYGVRVTVDIPDTSGPKHVRVHVEG